GVFRESCSQVLSTLREGREVLLTMLDAFVYDPLVDWAVSDHLTASSAAVGVAVTLAVYGTDSRAVEAKPVAREMFGVRIRENTALWTKNFTELQSALASVTDVLQRENASPENSAWNSRELLGQAHQLLDAEALDLNACLRHFAIVQNNICDIYLGLLSLNESAQPTRLLSPSTDSRNPPKSETPELPPGFEDPRPHHKQQQEQNAHASSVVRRVRARLEGRTDSSDPQKVASPSEQSVLMAIRIECVSAVSMAGRREQTTSRPSRGSLGSPFDCSPSCGR
ncbi:hypothetical protein COOONC_17210, partial [Cooperia oncophora]